MSKDKEKKVKKEEKNKKTKVDKLEKVKTVVKKIKSKKSKCDHMDYWSAYKMINFNRRSMNGQCGICGKEIHGKYLNHNAMTKNVFLNIFVGILWMSPAFLIVAIAILFSGLYGFSVYIIAMLAVLAYHFWAMYYIIKGGSLVIKEK